MGSPFEPFVDLLQELIYYSSSEMFVRLNSDNRNDLILQMPQFLIDRIPEAVQSRFGFFAHTDQSGVIKTFEGITVNPSTDLAITLFHKDYPLRNYDWMIVKIPIAPMQVIKGEWYEMHVLKLQECSYLKGKIDPVNN